MCGEKTKSGRKKKNAATLSFSESASKRITRLSRGVPRLIHLLADKAALSAYAEGVHRIEPRHIMMAAEETEGLSPLWRGLYRLFF